MQLLNQQRPRRRTVWDTGSIEAGLFLALLEVSFTQTRIPQAVSKGVEHAGQQRANSSLAQGGALARVVESSRKPSWNEAKPRLSWMSSREFSRHFLAT